MKVIMLAAGVGQRLGEEAAGKPKCLLEIGGKSLLRRHLEILQEYPVANVVIVTGYRQEDILAELTGINTSLSVQTIFNPEYTNGSVVSLWHARDALFSGDDIILMDADVLYDKTILHRLMTTGIPNCFLLDRDFEPGDEPVKLCVSDSRLTDFRKYIAQEVKFDIQGESVGFFRFAPDVAARLADRVQEYIEQHRHAEPYEEAIRDLLLADPETFGYEDITGLSWIEIDFPEDVRRAENEILRQI